MQSKAPAVRQWRQRVHILDDIISMGLFDVRHHRHYSDCHNRCIQGRRVFHAIHIGASVSSVPDVWICHVTYDIPGIENVHSPIVSTLILSERATNT